MWQERPSKGRGSLCGKRAPGVRRERPSKAREDPPVWRVTRYRATRTPTNDGARDREARIHPTAATRLPNRACRSWSRPTRRVLPRTRCCRKTMARESVRLFHAVAAQRRAMTPRCKTLPIMPDRRKDPAEMIMMPCTTCVSLAHIRGRRARDTNRCKRDDAPSEDDTRCALSSALRRDVDARQPLPPQVRRSAGSTARSPNQASRATQPMRSRWMPYAPST